MNRFSSSQLTILLVTAMLCLAVPATTVAAGIAKVSIAGSNGKTAKVAGGKLATSATVTGTVKAVQQGPVEARTAAPSSFFRSFGVLDAGPCTPIATAPATKGLVITNVLADTYANPTPGAGQVYRFYVGTTDCSTAVGAINPPGFGLDEIDYGPGLALAPGRSLYVLNSGSVSGEYLVNGYTVPASSVPARPVVRGGKSSVVNH